MAEPMLIPDRPHPGPLPKGEGVRRARSGFTLMELLLVLALVAAIAAMVWPALQRPLATQRLRRGAEQVRTQLIKARNQAILKGETFGFSYQPGKPVMRLSCYTENEALLESSGPSAQSSSQSGGSTGSAASSATTASGSAARPAVEGVLPEGVVFYGGDAASDERSDQFLAQERMSGSIDISWSQPLLFYSDGTALAGRIALVGDRGRAILIEVRSLTGGARISEITTVEALRQ